MSETAGRVGVCLHPWNERLAETARKPGHVAHVARDAVFVVGRGDRIRVEMEEVELVRKQFLPGAVVVVGLAPDVTARRVAEDEHVGRHGVHPLAEGGGESRARLVVFA